MPVKRKDHKGRVLREGESQRKNLLYQYRYTDEDGNQHAERLTSDLVNEIFCGEVQDLFILCFYVIRLNFNGFFKKITGLSGPVRSDTQKKRRRIV